jgi:hypothetical protein
MTTLTQALEHLDLAITKLEKVLDQRILNLEHQQKELFAQLDVERDRTKSVARELDTIIVNLEQNIHQNETAV